MKDRILRILQEKQLTSAKLADLITVQRSSISHILSGRNKPSMDFLEKILTNFSDISGDWLITGRGNMYKDGFNVENTAEATHIKQESNYSSDLFDSKPIRAKHDSFPNQKKQVQNTVSNDPIIIPKPAKVVKRVVIYYDDNSYDELFLNK